MQSSVEILAQRSFNVLDPTAPAGLRAGSSQALLGARLCVLVHRPKLEELQEMGNAWDSSTATPPRTTTRNPSGKTFTLYKVRKAPRWPGSSVNFSPSSML